MASLRYAVSTIPVLEHGAPVRWAMYDRDHTWPGKPNDWTTDRFKALAH